MEKTKVSKPRLSFSFSPLTIGYAVFGDFPAKVFPRSNMVRVNLRKAGIRISHVSYVSSMFLWATIIFVASYVFSSLFLTRLLGMFLPQGVSFLMTILLAVTAAAACFTIFLYYPIYVAGNKRRDIEKNLVYTSNYMSIMANAGGTIEQIFQSLANQGEIYGVRYIARNIVRNVEFLGQDVVSSLDETSKFSPSPEFAGLLQGFIATMKTGGSLSSYLSTMAEQYIESRRRLLGKLIEQLNLAGELYISALVALPIIFITMFMIMGFIGGGIVGGLTTEQLMPILIYVLIPIIAFGILMYIDSILSSW